MMVQLCNRWITIILFFGLLFCNSLWSQQDQTPSAQYHFSGKILATNNGLSLVPTFSLGKPALLFNLSLGGDKWTFEPDLRFALEGKPWSMLFWWRYKAITKEKFSLRLGGHPALNFRTIPAVSNGKSKEVIESRRYLASEIVPSYKINDHFNIGIYYLFGLGFDDSNRYTNFLVFNVGFPNLNLGNGYRLGLFPNIFYLTLDDLSGYYVSNTFSLSKKDFPFSLEAILNRAIKTEIVPEQPFVWNVSIVYSFNNQFYSSHLKH